MAGQSTDEGPAPSAAAAGDDEDGATVGRGEVTKEEFFSIFRAEQTAIRQALAAVEAGDGVNEELDVLLKRVQALEESFTRIAHILPAYDVQQYRTQSKEMAAQIAERREQLAPRKKFAFKKRAPAAGASAAASNAADAAPLDSAKPADGAPASSQPAAPVQNAGEVFEGLREELVVRAAEQLDGQDVTLRRLEGCRVLLLGRIGALHCHELKRCEICVAAVGSSALLYGCSDCVLTLAAKQLRLHDSERMLFHLHTLSGPVIEHSKQIAFAPYDLSLPGLEEHLREASLGTPVAEGGAWADVQDFNWHRRQASPNWFVLPAASRRAPLALASDAAASLSALGPLPPALRELEVCRDVGEAAASTNAAAAVPDVAAAAPAATPAAEAAPSKGAGAGAKPQQQQQRLDSYDEF